MAEWTRMTKLDDVDGFNPLTADHIDIEKFLLDVLMDWLESGWDMFRVPDKDSVDVINNETVIRLTRFEKTAFIPEKDGYGGD